jgi:hypothetical protein
MKFKLDLTATLSAFIQLPLNHMLNSSHWRWEIELILFYLYPSLKNDFRYQEKEGSWFKERRMPADETDRWDRSYLKES